MQGIKTYDVLKYHYYYLLHILNLKATKDDFCFFMK